MKNFLKSFLTSFFASAMGAIFALVILLFIATASMSAFVMLAGQEKTEIDSPILRINLSGIIQERQTIDPLSMAFFNFGVKNQGLNDILTAIKNAKTDDSIKGIYLNAGFAQAGISVMQEIRDALLDFKKSGKFIIAYGEVISQRTYYAASVADKIILNPLGMLDFRGLGSMQQYNKNIFEKMGIEIQVFKVGTYKSYIEPYTEEKMSDYDREQKSVYLNSIWNQMLTAISSSRDISTDSLNRFADEYLLFSNPESLVNYGLIDSLAYKIDFENSLKEIAGIPESEDLKFKKVSDMLGDYYTAPNKIAIVYAEGSIVSDAEEDLYSRSVITAKTYLKTFKEIQKDSSIKAVVFRVNSGGGSAYASDQIWHSVRELSKVKPVIASFGSYAASGGYYIACAADKIVSSPTALTGSIGIFGMFPSGEKLAALVGAKYDGVGTNKNTLFGAQVLSIPFLNAGVLPAKPLNESEHAMLQAYVERGYDAFLSRCAEGRSMSKESLDSVGQGRVWSGEQAIRVGLADTLGGIDVAVELAAGMADLEDYSIEEFPKMKDPFDKFFEEAFNSAKVKSQEFILGKEAYQTKQLLNALSHHDYRQAVEELRIEN